MITGTFAVIILAFVAVGWMLDRRASRRREDECLESGIFLGRTIGKLSEEAKSEMFADVMASYHERTAYVPAKERDRYMLGLFAFSVTCMVLAGLVWWSM